MKKNINCFENSEKYNHGKKVFLRITDFSIPFMLGKKYFLHHQNSKKYLNGLLCV